MWVLFTPTGPDPAAFAVALADHNPRHYVTNSALHNPTGGTITLQTAHRLLTLAGAHDLTIIEDDTFAALEPDLSPRLATLDGVIRIGSLSKTLSASIHCGYIATGYRTRRDYHDVQAAPRLQRNHSPALARQATIRISPNQETEATWAPGTGRF